MFEMIAAINNPRPMPISIQATKNKGEVCKKINPTPIPTMVMPPMAHELLSTFLSVILYLLKLTLQRWSSRNRNTMI